MSLKHLTSKILGCFLDMHLFSKKTINCCESFLISYIRNITSLLSCSNTFILSRSSLGSDDKTVVGLPGAMIAGDLINIFKCWIPSSFITRSFYIQMHLLCRNLH